MLIDSMLKVFVKDIVLETPTVKRFCLVPKTGGALPRFSPGSHITTYLLTDETVYERHYSLVSAPDQTSFYEIAVQLDPASRGGSYHWHHYVQPGTELAISYPKNHFPLSFCARHHALYAAGIGITPFLSMLAELKQKDCSFELHYAAKSRERCAFYEWLANEYAGHVHFYFSTENNRMLPDSMRDQYIGTHVYFCGPEAMVKQFSQSALQYGYPKDSVHFELFTPPRPQHIQPFRAELKRSGTTVDVAQNQTLLDALLAAGIKAPYSCRVGGCGTCMVEVLDGQIEHCDVVLSDEEKREQNVMLTCVSRAASDKIVLNL